MGKAGFPGNCPAAVAFLGDKIRAEQSHALDFGSLSLEIAPLLFSSFTLPADDLAKSRNVRPEGKTEREKPLQPLISADFCARARPERSRSSLYPPQPHLFGRKPQIFGRFAASLEQQLLPPSAFPT